MQALYVYYTRGKPELPRAILAKGLPGRQLPHRRRFWQHSYAKVLYTEDIWR